MESGQLPADRGAVAGGRPGGGRYVWRMTDTLSDWHAFRARMNDAILGAGDLTINRFFALDHRAYEPGVLGSKAKEMMGLVASLVLRCDDCVTYHVVRCAEEGVTDDEFQEVFAIGLVVGGSIVIPHLRRAVARLAEVRRAVAP
jgi:AhpD family alkylhydroperoxidase